MIGIIDLPGEGLYNKPMIGEWKFTQETFARFIFICTAREENAYWF
jgi:hypothetical protein